MGSGTHLYLTKGTFQYRQKARCSARRKGYVTCAASVVSSCSARRSPRPALSHHTGFNCNCALIDHPNCPSISLHCLFDSLAHRDSFAVRVTTCATCSHRVRARPRLSAQQLLSATAQQRIPPWSLNSCNVRTLINCSAIHFSSYNLDLFA
jgi:hypothetical protein